MCEACESFRASKFINYLKKFFISNNSIILSSLIHNIYTHTSSIYEQLMSKINFITAKTRFINQ